MSNNNVSIGKGSWFNKINQGDNNGDSKISFWKIVAGIIATIAAIAGIIEILITLGIISVNV